MGIFGQFGKMVRLNKDPDQLQIAKLLMYAGSLTPKEAAPVAQAIEKFVSDHGWRGDEAKDRLTHALSLVKASKAPRAVYDNATEVWRSLVGLL